MENPGSESYYVVGEGLLDVAAGGRPRPLAPEVEAKAPPFRFSRMGPSGAGHQVGEKTRQRLAAAMTRDLQQPWPARPIHVDVCYYVPEIGYAFTILPPHITYASGDPSHQGLIGFELLFHEASHTFADVEVEALSRACRAQGKDCGDLWHTLLFYTSGVELGRLLPAAEQRSFTPYAYKYGLYTRGDWPRYRRVLATDWQAYLDGKTAFDAAIGEMATNLGQ